VTPPLDRIFASEIECFSLIGVTADERSKPQKLVVDVEVQCDLRKPARTDSIDDSLDYGEIVGAVVDLAGRGEYRLLETLAELIANTVLSDLGGDSVRVLVRKPSPPLSTPLQFVSVELFRDRSETAN
jgi:dihydroneopterin aldolase